MSYSPFSYSFPSTSHWKLLNGLGAICLILLFNACSSPPPTVLESVVGAKEGLFRGFSMGTAQTTILEKEQLVLTDQQNGYCCYHVPLAGRDTASITYSFDQKGLYNVIVDIFLNDGASSDPVFADFVAHFTLRYGPAKISNSHYSTWESTENETIKLVKQTGSQGFGSIAIYLGRDFYMIDQIIGEAGGEFRGLSMGMTVEEVKQLEKIEPIDEEDDYLYYDYRLNRNDSYTLTYSFDSKGLYEIELDAYFEDNKEDAKILTELLLQHLSKIHGEPELSPEGMAKWVLSTEHSEEIELNLMDDSPTFPVGKVSVSIYDWVN